VVDSLTFFVSFALVLPVVVRAVERLPASSQPNLWANVLSVGSELRAGLRLIAQTPVLWGGLLVTGVMMLGLGSVNVLFVPFLANELRVPIVWFGVIEFAQVAGMVVSGGLAATVLRFKLGHVISGGAVGPGLSVVATAFAGAPWHVMATLFVVGCCVTPLQASVSPPLHNVIQPPLVARTPFQKGTGHMSHLILPTPPPPPTSAHPTPSTVHRHLAPAANQSDG
jgi:hypothetical protein